VTVDSNARESGKNEPSVHQIKSVTPHVVRIFIPSRWTSIPKNQIQKMTSIEHELSTAPIFKDLKEIFDKEWHDKELVFNTTNFLNFQKYADLVRHITTYHSEYLNYIALIWDCLLTVGLFTIWCRVTVAAYGRPAAAAAFLAVAYVPAAIAETELDQQLNHKLNVFFSTVSTALILSLIFFLIIIFVCIKK
jgi:F0F1-type ATP synthase membrane subunit c/vacuolar-type H+-ATPase subunit K